MQDEINKLGMSDTTGLRRYSAALSKDDVKRARQRAVLRVSEDRQVYQQSLNLVCLKITDNTAAQAPIDTFQIGSKLLAERTTITASTA